ncbi:DPH4 homolog [Rhopilema esculentum]|uniref:DPH4 homolog n=1 Tax=Rhopilema esculentum TaxID=499914 RepID=UPI0031E12D57|eukprot:gene3381-1731_t
MCDVEINYYDVLGVDENASLDEMKTQYRKLLLKIHPDKQAQNDKSINTVKFLEVEEAWKILSDPKKRQEYDALQKEKEIGQYAPFDLEVNLDDMSFFEVSETYAIDCRCGGEYAITEEQLKEGYNVVQCSSCTLQAQVN